METEQAQKPSEIETVMRSINVKLPKRFDFFLQGVAKIADVSIEEVLLDALYSVLTSYLQGGYLENWTDWVIQNRTELEEEVRRIDC